MLTAVFVTLLATSSAMAADCDIFSLVATLTGSNGQATLDCIVNGATGAVEAAFPAGEAVDLGKAIQGVCNATGVIKECLTGTCEPSDSFIDSLSQLTALLPGLSDLSVDGVKSAASDIKLSELFADFSTEKCAALAGTIASGDLNTAVLDAFKTSIPEEFRSIFPTECISYLLSGDSFALLQEKLTASQGFAECAADATEASKVDANGCPTCLDSKKIQDLVISQIKDAQGAFSGFDLKDYTNKDIKFENGKVYVDGQEVTLESLAAKLQSGDIKLPGCTLSTKSAILECALAQATRLINIPQLQDYDVKVDGTKVTATIDGRTIEVDLTDLAGTIDIEAEGRVIIGKLAALVGENKFTLGDVCKVVDLSKIEGAETACKTVEEKVDMGVCAGTDIAACQSKVQDILANVNNCAGVVDPTSMKVRLAASCDTTAVSGLLASEGLLQAPPSEKNQNSGAAGLVASLAAAALAGAAILA